MKILLVEPDYKNKYPPLGLMKLSSFHKNRNDLVHFFKGSKADYRNKRGINYNLDLRWRWDRIYISSIFTFQYRKTVKTIKLAKEYVKKDGEIYLGGPGSILLKNKYSDFDVKIVEGLLKNGAKIDLQTDECIDKMIPDYEILDQIDYEYPTTDSYIAYSTRGCVNNCEFCAVSTLEPEYDKYIDLKKIVKGIEKKHGEKRNLLLMDNNVLASEKFDEIIQDIIDLGFEKGAKDSQGRKRSVDFNQGLDARQLTPEKAELLGKIAINPARLAFDYVEMKDIYREKVGLLAENDVHDLSNFLLYNFKDEPKDLLKRILINIELNEEEDVKIYSFPMRYIPLDATNRRHVGDNWNRKKLRAIQNILHATHGIVGPKRPFVQKAFCNMSRERSEKGDYTYEELLERFQTLLWMPEKYIMYRESKKKEEANKWWEQFKSLSDENREKLKEILKDNMIHYTKYKKYRNPKIENVLKHYELLNERFERYLKRNPELILGLETILEDNP